MAQGLPPGFKDIAGQLLVSRRTRKHDRAHHGGKRGHCLLARGLARHVRKLGRQHLDHLIEPIGKNPPRLRALAAWPGSMVIVSHDPEFVEALEPGRVMFMPEGRVDYWEEDLLDVVSMA